MRVCHRDNALANRVPIDPRVRWNINGRDEAQTQPVTGLADRKPLLHINFCRLNPLRQKEPREWVRKSRHILSGANDDVIEDPVASRYRIPRLGEHARAGEINPATIAFNKPDGVWPKSRTGNASGKIGCQ